MQCVDSYSVNLTRAQNSAFKGLTSFSSEATLGYQNLKSWPNEYAVDNSVHREAIPHKVARAAGGIYIYIYK